MNYRDYEWSGNPRGLHHRNLMVRLERYFEPQMGWAKFVAGGGEFIRACDQLLQGGITPIYRIFRPNMGAMRMEEEHYTVFREYMAVGVKWFELYNEPNLEGEWPQNSGPGGGPVLEVNYENYYGCIKPMMDNWLEWAENIIEMGGYPAFPALTDSSDHRHSTIFWYREFLNYLADVHYQRTYDVFTNGGWAATHPYLFNHFYQAVPGGPADEPRFYLQQNGNEPGWHFEYPYDPLQQSYDPGRTVFGGTALAPNGDTNGLIAAGDCFNRIVGEYWGIGPLPVVATEGGATVPDPGRDDELFQQDERFPPYSTDNFSEVTIGMWRWIAEQAPGWFWGLTLWDEPGYYDVFGEVPVIDRMAAEPVIRKPVPSFDTTSRAPLEPRFPVPASFRFRPGVPPWADDEDFEPTPQPTNTLSPDVDADPDPTATPEAPVQPTNTPAPTATVIGPAVVNGQPDHHWLLLAPGLQADWFFRAARTYWQIFRPTVLTSWEMLPEWPTFRSLAITVLARTDTISYMNEQIRDAWPNVFYDPVVFNTLAEMQAELDRRAEQRRRFG